MDKISFVVPVYNEEENLCLLADELKAVAPALGVPCEFLLVDDCSRDGSLALMRKLATEDERFKFLAFARNSGQSAAMWAGFQHASGDVIITLDADLQNDPADLPAMMKHYGSEYQMVSGWRYNRQDSLSKKLASRLGNWVRNQVTGDSIHDTGCSLKIMNASMLRRVPAFRGLHRFLPTLMRLEGARVIEVKVNHRPRLHGESKYTNLRRGIEGFCDLLAVRWMMSRHLRVEIGETNVRI